MAEHDVEEFVAALRALIRPKLEQSGEARRFARALGALLLAEAERCAPAGADVDAVPASVKRAPSDASGISAPAPAPPGAGLISGPRVVTPEPAREVPLRIGDAGARVRVFGRPEEIARAYAAAEGQEPERPAAPDRSIDLDLLAHRSRLKAEACRVYVARRAAAGDPEREPALIDRIEALIERARELPDCFLWMVFRDRAQPDDETLALIGRWYDALAEGAGLLCELDASPAARRADLVEAMQFLAHAASGLRIALERTWLVKPDVDQDEAHLWLRWETKVRQVLVPRYMRLEDPAPLSSVEDLAADIAGARRALAEGNRRSTAAAQHLKRVRYHVEQIAAERSFEPAHDWRRIEAALAELEALGYPPRHPRVAEAFESLADGAAAPDPACERSARALAAVRELVTASAEEAPDRVWSDRTLEVRSLLAGRRLVVIGGEPRVEAMERLRNAFNVSEVEWVHLTEHGSGASMRAPISRPDTALVLVLVKLAGHLHVDEAREYARQAGKPAVLLQAGYNPERVAFAVLAQASHQLRSAG